MKRMVCGILALAMALAIGCALADQRVNLPDSRVYMWTVYQNGEAAEPFRIGGE